MPYIVNGVMRLSGSDFTRIDRVTEAGMELMALVRDPQRAHWIVEKLNQLCDKEGPPGLYCKAEKGHDQGEPSDELLGIGRAIRSPAQARPVHVTDARPQRRRGLLPRVWGSHLGGTDSRHLLCASSCKWPARAGARSGSRQERGCSRVE